MDESISSIGEILYDWAQRGAEEEPDRCPCRGRGWILTPLDTWIACRLHEGPHPESEE